MWLYAAPSNLAAPVGARRAVPDNLLGFLLLSLFALTENPMNLIDIK
jgi:hypothetical protein